MPPTRFPRVTAYGAGQSPGGGSFAPRPAARHNSDDDWDDGEPDPDNDEHWDPDTLDDDEPEPEPGDFWLDTDDD